MGVKSALRGNSLLLLLNRGLSHCGFYNPFAKRKCFRTFSLTLFDLPSYNVYFSTKVLKVVFVIFLTVIVDEYSQLLLRPILNVEKQKVSKHFTGNGWEASTLECFNAFIRSEKERCFHCLFLSLSLPQTK